MRTHLHRTLISLSVLMLVAACGGGGGDSTPSAAPDSGGQNGGSNNPPGGNQGGNNPPPSAGASMLMSCPDTDAPGTTAQCSGSTVVITADKGNGVLVTNSGVQVYGISTSDLDPNNTHTDKATGFKLAANPGALAEVRLFKGADSVVSKPALLLSNFGIKWNGVDERPPIIETFLTTIGRVTLGAPNSTGNAPLVFSALPAASDTTFFNFNSTTHSGTQANYANNRYFTNETTGIGVIRGDWRSPGTGTNPDTASGIRLHEDGDPAGRNAPSVGNKGYRDFANYSYRYANMAKWVSQDTVDIAEWMVTPTPEHNLNRRGVIAFGDVTAPANVPTTGKVTYKGWVYGWYASSANIPGDPDSFHAEATVLVDFAARTATVTVNPATAVNDTLSTPTTQVPLPAIVFSTTAQMGAAGSDVTNYLTGALASGNLKGGIGGRFFGPIDTTSSGGGSGPAEIAGSFSMSDATTGGAAAIGGFIAIKHDQ